MADIYYFGCWSALQGGHFLYCEGRNFPLYEVHLPADFPCKPHVLDGGLLPRGPEIEGQARIWKTSGWTVATFWDRSADKRGACNSAFICRGDLSLDEVLAKAREAFPSIVERFTFQIVDAAAGRGGAWAVGAPTNTKVVKIPGTRKRTVYGATPGGTPYRGHFEGEPTTEMLEALEKLAETVAAMSPEDIERLRQRPEGSRRGEEP